MHKIVERIVIFLIVCLGVQVQAFATGKGTSLPRKEAPAKRALLIGINTYKHVLGLRGCENDVLAMKELLTTKFVFPLANVKRLTGTQATRANILAAFQQLISDTREGDIVVIHYSGHGSQIVSLASAEVDKMDETILPYDYNPKGVLPITDKMLAALLAKLNAKTPNVTFILDCCHSGGGAKSTTEGKPRWVEEDKRTMPASEEPSGKSELKNDKAGYVLLSGCRADQLSYEIRVNGNTFQGSMTYYLVQELKRQQGATTWPQVLENIRHLVAMRNPDQTPQLEGTRKNSYVFGDQYVLAKQYVNLRVAPTGMQLDGGGALGFTVGSVFNVYPQDEIRFDGAGIATIRITRTDALTSFVVVDSGALATGNFRAVERSHAFGSSELFIRFKGNWQGALQEVKRSITRIPGVGEDKLTPHITLEHEKGDIVFYWGNDSVYALPCSYQVGSGSATDLADAIRHWLTWFHTANIRNPNPTIDVAVNLLRSGVPDNGTGDLVFSDGEIIQMEIVNKSPYDIFINVADLQDDGAVDVYSLAQLHDPTQTTQQFLKANKRDTISLQMSVKHGTQSRDIMKVFASGLPLDLSYLQQRPACDLDRDLQDKDDPAKRVRPVNRALAPLNAWNTLEKVIVVKKSTP